jgi:hypothetical protein
MLVVVHILLLVNDGQTHNYQLTCFLGSSSCLQIRGHAAGFLDLGAECVLLSHFILCCHYVMAYIILLLAVMMLVQDQLLVKALSFANAFPVKIQQRQILDRSHFIDVE